MSRISPARIRVVRATSSTLSPRASRAADSVAPIAMSARRSGWVTVHLLRRPWYGGIVGYQAFPRWVGRLGASLGGSAPRARRTAGRLRARAGRRCGLSAQVWTQVWPTDGGDPAVAVAVAVADQPGPTGRPPWRARVASPAGRRSRR